MNMTSNRDTSLHSDTDTIDDADSIMNLTTIESTEPSSTTTTSTGKYSGLLSLCSQC